MKDWLLDSYTYTKFDIEQRVRFLLRFESKELADLLADIEEARETLDGLLPEIEAYESSLDIDEKGVLYEAIDYLEVLDEDYSWVKLYED